MTISRPPEIVDRIVARSAQMRAIEERMFAAGMPVAALMEKVAGLLARQIFDRLERSAIVGVIVGPGHNGGDALVIARELHHQGYPVRIWQPFPRLKELTQAHANYDRHLGIPWLDFSSFVSECALFIDGLFGFGLEREISGDTADRIWEINASGKPIFSIDLPSGIHTETGAVLGKAIKATHTFCLGLWKPAFLQDSAIDYIGTAELIDFDIPLEDIDSVLAESERCYRITRESAIAALPLPRPLLSHKYTNGHLLLVCGSQQYAGSAILTGLGARASGVGMLSIASPESLKYLLDIS
ncbi:NAD(P)H-hydrate epimerase [Roseofilum casamattae]|uniref:NAD(P)H-hydrate epimerase n=1 Tax=Roseofilum casamattae TaxID=3082944 RepID=UPI0024BD7183|nr:NAD(P)H-hydrate epimerase [Roseofilum casamattae]